jgi:hypothetical protein
VVVHLPAFREATEALGVSQFRSPPERNGGHRTGFNARLRDELLSVEVFRSMASEMLLRSQRKLHHAFQELVRRQADEVVHDELLGV